MKVLVRDVTLNVNGGRCEIIDSPEDGLWMELVGYPDEELNTGQVLLVVDKVSVTVGAQDLADALLPFLARCKRLEAGR
jgi:hypothetical protein